MTPGSSTPPSYAPLHNKEDGDSIDGLDMLPLHRSRNPRRENALRAAKVISALVLVAFIVLTFALSFHAVDLLGKIGHLINEPKPASHQRSYKYPCGQTATEAKEKGCIFDIMSMAWQSPECFDEDLHEEFMDLGPWKFYSDETATHELTYEQVSQRGQISWAERRFSILQLDMGGLSVRMRDTRCPEILFSHNFLAGQQQALGSQWAPWINGVQIEASKYCNMPLNATDFYDFKSNTANGHTFHQHKTRSKLQQNMVYT
ncbi:hypothetical protein BLS_002566 [Venturia inaequalis]|uniref:Uncharacterized protein n=1 Tax=Venturia inaequalis TaxID=5025 RepID=A0A8H3UQZ4_VENIN|nr:hypothetical protein BLS_002566 [Venturia inaequalis]